ncbi:MAG: hypothetical protein WKF94_13635 [Solirubrobacteraceae bacterium]
MARWLPPVYRVPQSPRRVQALSTSFLGSSARPGLRLLTIALLTILSSLLAIGIGWAIAL